MSFTLVKLRGFWHILLIRLDLDSAGAICHDCTVHKPYLTFPLVLLYCTSSSPSLVYLSGVDSLQSHWTCPSIYLHVGHWLTEHVVREGAAQAALQAVEPREHACSLAWHPGSACMS
jgi:hypothetical protein